MKAVILGVAVYITLTTLFTMLAIVKEEFVNKKMNHTYDVTVTVLSTITAILWALFYIL